MKKRISCYGRRQITTWKRGRWTCLGGKTGKTRFVVQGAKIAVMMQQRKLPEVKQSNIRTMDWYIYRSVAADWKSMMLAMVSDASWSNETEYRKENNRNTEVKGHA